MSRDKIDGNEPLKVEKRGGGISDVDGCKAAARGLTEPPALNPIDHIAKHKRATIFAISIVKTIARNPIARG